MKQQQGFLIALEGIDGSGKTTLGRSLKITLEERGLPVLLTKEPGATQFGMSMKAALMHRAMTLDPIAEFLLFSADRAQHMEEIIIPALSRGMIVISDRMADSARAYQGFGRGLDMTMIDTVTRWVMKGIQPDMTLYISLDASTAWKRIQLRGEPLTVFEQEQRMFFDRVIKGFETLYTDRPDVCTLNGLLSQQELSNIATRKILCARNQETEL